MKRDVSLRVNIFVISVVVILLGQSVYSYFNLQSFQDSYIQTLRDKCSRVGTFLRDDIHNVLKLGIPLDNIAGLERSLARTLRDIPEAGFIEVVDRRHNLLYRAEPQETGPESGQKSGQKSGQETGPEAGENPPGTTKGSFQEKPYAPEITRMGLTPQDTDITIPLEPKQEIVGYLNIHISGRSIQAKSRQILWDMLTVMLTSLLLTFEFLTFFVVYYIKYPLDVLRRDIAFRFPGYRPVNPEKFQTLGEIGILAAYYNAIIHYQLSAFGLKAEQQQRFADTRQKIHRVFAGQDARITALTRKINTPADREPLADAGTGAVDTLRNCLHETKKQTDRLRKKLERPAGPIKLSDSPGLPDDASQRIPYSLIRPLIFLFIMADAFSLSFFPMFVDSMYEPIFGLSREMVISVPMSAFMLVLAFSMPLAGNLTDSKGWYKPLILGLTLNAAGHVFTALAQDITQLIVFRSLAAAGFGIVFMCCQRFVIDNTSLRSRAMGMSGFLAAFFSGDICGTVIGGMIAERIGFASVFYVSAIFTGLALFFLLAVFRGSFRPPREASRDNIGMPLNASELVTVFRDREFSTLVWLQAVPAKLALVGFLFFFVPLYLNSIGALQSNIGRVIMCYSICIIFVGPAVSYLLPQERFRKYLVALGGLITAGAMLSFTVASGLVPLLFIVILLGIAQSISVPSQASIISETRVVKAMGAGAGMGIYRFWERTGNVAGPLFMAFLLARLGYEKAVVVLGIVTLMCSLLYLGAIALRTKPSNQIDRAL